MACRLCCFCLVGVLIALILLFGIPAGLFFHAFRPNYSMDSISIKNFNVSSSSPISPEFDVSVRADNPNNKIGIYYLTGGSVSVFHRDAKLSSGVLPVFLQGRNNVTVFTAVLKGTEVVVTRGLVREATRRAVRLRVDMRVPVKFQYGSVKTSWRSNLKVHCHVTVDNLTANAKIVSKECGYSFLLFPLRSYN